MTKPRGITIHVYKRTQFRTLAGNTIYEDEDRWLYEQMPTGKMEPCRDRKVLEDTPEGTVVVEAEEVYPEGP